MSSLGSLIVTVGADIANFTSDMNRAAKIADQSGSKMGETLGKAAAVIGAAALAAGAAVVKMVADSIDAADNMRDMSIAIGTSTEALSQLEFAAGQSGSSLEQVVKGMAKMQSAVADANAGLKTQSDAFEALGLSSQALRQMSPEEQFKTIADALAGMTNATDRTAYAADIFGQKISVGLMPLLMEGSAGIGDMMKQADALGLTLSGSAADGADEFNDSINILGSATTGFGRQMMSAVLPALNETIGQLVESASASHFAADAAEFLAGVFKTLVGAVIVVKNAFDIVSKAVVAFAVIVVETFKALISPITAFVSRVAEAFDELSQGNFKKAAAAMGQITTDIKQQFTQAGVAIAAVAKDMAQGAFEDVKEAGKGVNAVFNATAKTAKTELKPALADVGAEAERTAEETKALERETKRLADVYDDIIDVVDPLGQLTRKYESDMADLSAVAKKYNLTAQEMWVYQVALDKEFNAAYRAAELYAAGLEEVVVTAKTWAETYPQLASQMGKVATDTETEITGVAAVIEETFKRLDTTFATFWTDLLKNGKISLSSIKDLFLETLGQMIHAAVTQPIILRIGTAMTGGLATGAANASGGGSLLGLGGIGEWLMGGGTGTVVGSIGAGAVGGLAGIGLGGNGTFESNVGGAIGATALGIAGYAFGAVLGGPLGAMIGSAIGAFVGGLIGSFVGGLFSSDPQIMGGGAGGFKNLKDTQFFDSALGGVYIGKTKRGLDEHVEEFGKAITDFDNAIAGFLSKDQIDKVSAALNTWQSKLVGDSISIEAMLGSRFEAILSTFGSNVQNYVNSFDGLEAKTEALARFVTALNTVGATIANFVSMDPASELAKQLDDASKSSTIKLQDLGTSLLDLFATFDGTPEMMDQISQAVDARYRGEMEYLMAINQLIAGISASIAAQQQSIREAIEGPKSFTDIMQEAFALFGQISTASSPEALAQIVSGIQNLIGKGFGGLSEEEKLAKGGTLIAFLDEIESAATARADQLAQMVIDEGTLLREQALMFAESIGAPLDLNVAATDAVNDSINRQTDVIIGTSDNRDALLRELIGLIRQGNDLATVRG